MSTSIQVDIDGLASVQAALQRIVDQSQDLTPLMMSVAQTLAAETESNFAAQGRPSWVPLLESTRASRAAKGTGTGKMLQVTGRLASSITTAHTNNTAQVGTNVIYAAIHQFGGQTAPHTIAAKYAKALAWPGGGFAKKVNHPGSKIPARPFLPFTMSGGSAELQPSAQAAVIATANRFIQRMGGGAT
jgi:phage virion morphogenesis protein